MNGLRARLVLGLAGAVALGGVIATPGAPRAAPAPVPVDVFPSPGAGFATTATGITFRGVPAGYLGAIVVTGSRSGVHAGRVAADSDGRGGSFLPARPFRAGETVTVQTGLDIVGGQSGRFSFRVATPGRPLGPLALKYGPVVKGGVMSFHSRGDLRPPAVAFTRRGRTEAGDLFLAPQLGPLRDGPMILDPAGRLLWFDPLPGRQQAADLRVQTLGGRSVLTWWQGTFGPGIGLGEGEIVDSSYRSVAKVHAGNGLSMDLHEFQLTPQGTALIVAVDPVTLDARSIHGSVRQTVWDSVVQEIDIPTGLVLFQWSSLDHIPLSESILPVTKAPVPYDPIHVNSVALDGDGSLIVSARGTSTVLKVDHATGQVIWRLGGRSSSFRMPAAARFALQHDARIRAPGDRLITLFDDGAGPPKVHDQSRGLTLALDPKRFTVRVVSQFVHAPALLAYYEGNMQVLPHGDVLVGWGQGPYFTEFNSRGRTLLDAHFVQPNTNYRVYRLTWSATPGLTLPAAAAEQRGGQTIVYASWNGATTVARWRVLGGSATRMRPLVTAPRSDFETTIPVPKSAQVAVQALDSAGRVLATSRTIAPR